MDVGAVCDAFVAAPQPTAAAPLPPPPPLNKPASEPGACNTLSIMLKRPVFSIPVSVSYALPTARAFAAVPAVPAASTRHPRNLNATSISVKPDFSLKSSAKLIETEQAYSAHNYHPLPVVFSRAQVTTTASQQHLSRDVFNRACTCGTPRARSITIF